MNEIQIKLLEILKEFDALAKKLNIKYFLAYGTLLGAVRHQGFIPWDDDIDVFVLREDYEKLKKLGPNLINQPFFLQSNITDKYWYFPYMKLRNSNTTAIELTNANYNQGLWIDIFPLDNRFPNIRKNNIDEIKRQLCLRRISIKNKRKVKWKGFLYNLLVLVLIPNVNFASKLLEKIATKYNKDETDYLSCIWSKLNKSENLFPKNDFSSSHLGVFESIKVPVIDSYDNHLTRCYGDWRKIPPENQRQSCHTIVILDLKKSYKYYLERSKK